MRYGGWQMRRRRQRMTLMRIETEIATSDPGLASEFRDFNSEESATIAEWIMPATEQVGPIGMMRRWRVPRPFAVTALVSAALLTVWIMFTVVGGPVCVRGGGSAGSAGRWSASALSAFDVPGGRAVSRTPGPRC
jgi:hypothetical protein